jgi:putative acetyltransferase
VSAVPWSVRAEDPSGADRAAVRRVVGAAFPTPAEADLVDALREDPEAWLPGLSWVVTDDQDPEAGPVGHALVTRCRVGGEPAAALAPCSVLPDHQGRGAGTAVIEAVLDAAREAGERLVVVLGHPDYYPRFGFRPASGLGIRAPFDVPDDAMMALVLDPAGRPVPSGLIAYPSAFAV